MSNEPTSMIPYDMTDEQARTMEAVVVGGDLSKLNASQRVEWYRMRCEAAGLDPRTQPFQYLNLQGKLTLYATKTATEQLCAVRKISTSITDTKRVEDIYIVTCRATMPDGRFTDATGAVTVGTLKGDPLCNALMKAETKAKRRAVLALCGLGMMDESEVETVPGAITNGNGYHAADHALQEAPVPESKATEQELREYTNARANACLFGYKTPNGNDPAPANPDWTGTECIRRTSKLLAYLRDHGDPRNNPERVVIGPDADADAVTPPDDAETYPDPAPADEPEAVAA